MLNYGVEEKIVLSWTESYQDDPPPPDGIEIARGSYIVFLDHGIPKNMKTHVFSVWTLENGDRAYSWVGVKLGEVRWYGAWRKYDFSPAAGTRFEEVCMGEISEFIVSQTRAHKEKAKKHAAV